MPPLKLSEVFGLEADALEARWPFPVVSGATEGIPPGWLLRLNEAIQLHEVRMNASGGIVSLEAAVSIHQGPGAEPLPFFLSALPGITFVLLEMARPEARLYAALGEAGMEILIEGLPVEIRLPADLIGAQEEEDGNLLTGPTEEQFSPGQLDHQFIHLSQRGETSVYTHLRAHITPDFAIHLSTPAPISFGKCRFIGLPCHAVHDFRLVPSPQSARDSLEWLRHDVTDNIRTGGVFAIRSLDLDLAQRPLRDLMDRSERSEGVELVVEDLVMPLQPASILPLPTHITLGLRRNLESLSDMGQIFDLDSAPWIFYFDPPQQGDGNRLAFAIRRLFIRSMGVQENEPPLDVQFDLALRGEDQDFWATFGVGENLTLRVGIGHKPQDNALRIKISDWIVLDLLLEVRVGLSYGLVAHGTPLEEAIEITADFWIHDPDARLEPTSGAGSNNENEPPNENDPGTGHQNDSGGTGQNSDDTGNENEPGDVDNENDSREAGSGQLRVKTAGDRPFSLAILGMGWRNGGWTFGESIQLPGGANLMLGTVGLSISEMGTIAEEGGSYFSISGGLLLREAGSFEGGVWFRRLRFLVSGNPELPPFKLDGISALLTVPNVVSIEIGGYYTDETLQLPAGDGTNIDVRRSEFGLSGKVTILVTPTKYLFLLDLIVGKISPTGPANPSSFEPFDYFMFQLVVQVPITLAAIEVRSIRALVAMNMLPKLGPVAEASGEMRYYNWSRANDPLTVPGERRLAAWHPVNHSLAIGIGLTLSFTGLGDVFRLQAFGMYLNGPDEEGLLIAIELFLMKARNPLAWAVLELDFRQERFSLLIGLDVNLSQFIENAPEFLDNLFKLKGTLFIGNKPGTFALGRLDNQESWLTLIFDLNLFDIFEVYFLVALCVEIVENGPNGMGFVFRLRGGMDLGFLAMSFYAGVLFIIRSLQTGSGDLTVVLAAEMGISLRVLWFLEFGLNLTGRIEHVAHAPKYTIFRLMIQLDLPFFLPDITWSVEHVDGSIDPPARPLVTAPLLSGGASHPVTGKSQKIHLERLDKKLPEPEPPAEPPTDPSPTPGSSETSRLTSLQKLAEITLPEEERMANFADAVSVDHSEAVKPIHTDSTLSVLFSAMVQDCLDIGGTEPEHGIQSTAYQAGDSSLNTRYRLTGLQVRRRPRFGAERDWTLLEQRREGSSTEGILPLAWDIDVQIDGATAPKKLLINASTPFDLITQNPYGDERMLQHNPSWPCCPPDPPRPHTFHFRAEPEGPLERSRRRLFSNSESTVWIMRPGTIKTPNVLSGAETECAASFDADSPGSVLRAAFDSEVLRTTVRLAAAASATGVFTLDFTGFNRAGDPVQTDVRTVHGELGWTEMTLEFSGGLLSVELRVAVTQPGQAGSPWDALPTMVEVDQLTYQTVDESLFWLRRHQKCGEDGSQSEIDYGRKLFLLANHEYEFAISTEVAVRHSTSSDWSTVNLTEYLYAQTKGLPGLNAVDRNGAELEPYVASTYTGGRGLLYRSEPVAVVFREDLNLLVPLHLRPPGFVPETRQLEELALTVRPDHPSGPEPVIATATSDDWLTSHRVILPEFPVKRVYHWASTSHETPVPALSIDPFLGRLANLVLRPETGCELPDPRQVQWSILLADPHGSHPEGVTDLAFWLPTTTYQAVVRPRGSPWIQRQTFEVHDLSAFRTLDADGNHSPTGWSFENGAIQFSGPAGLHFARFGELDWDHLEVTVGLSLQNGRAGIAFGLSGSGPAELFALVRRVDETTVGLQVLAEPTGPPLVGESNLPWAETISLTITLFADVLRIKAGTVTLEVPRGEARPGFCALVAEGDASFYSLAVSGLAMYQFSFTTSRYAGFSDHIGSFDSLVATIDPGEARQHRLADLYQAEVLIQAMQVTEPDSTREALFTDWTAEAGAFLSANPAGLRLTRLRAGSEIEGLLLESPEPLDFVEEITLALARKPPALTGGPVQIGEESIPLAVLQNGKRTKALLIPVSDGHAIPLPEGNYRLDFSFQRRRWESLAGEDSENTYRDFQHIEFPL